MTSNWTILEIAFHEAVTLDDSGRAGYVADFAIEHPELAAKLRALLAADAADCTSPGEVVSAALRFLSGRSR